MVFAGAPVLASDINILTDAQDSPLPLGEIKRGRRTTATGNITTTETGVLRVDSIPVYGGRAYRITTSNINLDTSIDDDVAAARIRISTSGNATTSSTQIGELRNTIDDASQSNKDVLNCMYYPSSDGTLSVLLSAIRMAGTGNIVVFCSGTEILDLVITDEALAPSDTGVVI